MDKIKNNPKTLSNSIKPLFLLIEGSQNMGQPIVAFAQDDYNKAIGNNALIDAKNDAEAVSLFLAEFRDAPLTLKSYAKEIERLLLWCIHIGQVNISSLRRNHLLEYKAFLQNPQPRPIWVGSKVARRLKDGSANPRWRPFGKPLSDTTIHKVMTILDAFFNYLVQTHYLTGNPLAMERRRKRNKTTQTRLIERYLELVEIETVLNAIKALPKSNPQQHFQALRAQYIILLLFYTGLRISEAANHRMGHFIQRETHWFLRVIGKGKKIRDIPIPDDLLKALGQFRLAVGLLSPQPRFQEKTPLIPMANLQRPISPRRIDQILKWAFSLGAITFETTEPHRASKLRQASAHWLRHSYVTYLLELGAPLKVAQENAGHSDVSTTLHYRHVAQTDRHEATRALSLSRPKHNKQ